jgi:IS5 family transposase
MKDDSSTHRVAQHLRKRVGAERLEKLLEATIHAALAMRAVKPQEFQKVNVDTTVQEKAIAFPTDARLYHKMRAALVRRAQTLGIKLRQNYRFKSKKLLAKQGRYAHAQQLKRAAKATRQLKTFLGRVLRDVRRKATFLQGRIADERLRELVALAERLMEQTRSSKHKLYSVHAPEVECIAKGKVHKRYEFGCKTSVATTSKSNWIVGTQALLGNPYDGHTLSGAIGQVEQLTGCTPKDVMVDQGYRGHGYAGSAIVHVVRTIPKRATRAFRRMLKRRAAIEPTIGHMKSDNRMNRNYLTGQVGDKINAVLAAAGYNFRKLLHRQVQLVPPSGKGCNHRLIVAEIGVVPREEENLHAWLRPRTRFERPNTRSTRGVIPTRRRVTRTP